MAEHLHIAAHTIIPAGERQLVGFIGRRSRRRDGDGQGIAVLAGISGDGTAAGQRGLIQRVPAMQIDRCNRRAASKYIPGSGGADAAGAQIHPVLHEYLGAGFDEQLHGELQCRDVRGVAHLNLLGDRTRRSEISELSGIETAQIGHVVELIVAALRQPESDGVGGGIFCLRRCQTAFFKGIAVLNDDLQACANLGRVVVHHVRQVVGLGIGNRRLVLEAVSNKGTHQAVLGGFELIPRLLGGIVGIVQVGGVDGRDLAGGRIRHIRHDDHGDHQQCRHQSFELFQGANPPHSM